MKASIQCRPATIRAIVLTAKLVVLCTGLLIASAARADVVVKGSKLPWTATIPDDWVGGTAEDIERILVEGGTSSGERILDEILRQILAEAKGLDAFFVHLDVSADDTKTISMLRVNVAPTNIQPLAEEARRKSFWAGYAKLLAKDFPEGSKVEVTQDRSTMTGGREAYEATFLTTLPDGGKVYAVVHVVAYAPGQTHVFSLKADAGKFRARFAEFKKILDSLNYRSE